ncbi:MerC domain-containing protein [Puia dinghuensis]|uniref:Membrane protein n=1 Tax=Puia dinghuensis TaxID=1792502 RepID=A0A8J2UFM3_9BACT|nr:MerC domain-containing protein [Puia dinghuensis]GGB11005.1 membrane protein [Puia dinghuensis]
MFKKINWDALGVTTSVLCAIHCAILPLVIATLPVLGINIIHNPLFENGMIGLAFVIGTRAMWHGFRHHHQHLMPWLLFLGGMIFLVSKQIWHHFELALLPFAVVLIVTAHILNYRLSRRPRNFPIV